MDAVIKSAVLLGGRHYIDGVAGHVDDRSAGDSYLRHDIARVHVRGGQAGYAYVGVEEVDSPQRRGKTGVSIERIDAVVLGRHNHDVVNAVSGNCYLRHVERLRVNI